MNISLNRIIATFNRTLAYVATGCICMLPLSSCRSHNGDSRGDMPAITVSIPPLEYFATAIGGDSLEVTTLLPAGADPETFDPGTSTMKALARSGALAVCGNLPFEESLLGNLSSNNPGLRVFDMSRNIAPIYGTHSHAEGERHNHSESEADPHIWSSVRNGIIIADNMLAALNSLAPQHKEYYTRRHHALVSRLDSIDRSIGQKLGTDPGRAFLIWHPSLSYLARDYGLTQVALNAENKETSSQRLHSILQKTESLHPVAFIVPRGLDPRLTEGITEATGLQPVSVDLMSADWEQAIGATAEALAGSPQAVK